jgi:hypothetical protein
MVRSGDDPYASGVRPVEACDGQLMRCYPVSTRINHVANNDEECSALVELAQIQNQLFL